jgi:uncharacterized protein (DUF427 family)
VPDGKATVRSSRQVESVWDYPRPPRIEPAADHVTVEFGGKLIADTVRACRVLETSHPPSFYIPLADIDESALIQSRRRTVCEWKGRAFYFTVLVDGRRAEDAAWHYPDPTSDFEAIRGHVAFYAGRMDVCRVDGESVSPESSPFYGGWVTANISFAPR